MGKTTDRAWRGNPALEDFLVSLDSVKPNPGNARRHLKRDIAATAASFEEHGQQEPIVLNREMFLLAGEGRWLAARSLGWTHIAALASDIDGDGQQQLYAIRDNRTAELSDWDLGKLAAHLQRLSGTVDLVATGLWAPYELEPLLNAALEKPRTIAVTVEQWGVFERALVRLREDDEDADADALVRLVSEGYLAQGGAS